MRTRWLVGAVLAALVVPDTVALAHGGGSGSGEAPRHADHSAPRSEHRHRSGTFSFDLTGSQVPGGGDPRGRGSATLRLYPDDGVVCLAAGWRDVAGQVTAVHLHRGARGETGPHHIEILNDEHLAGRANRVELCVQVAGGGHADHGGTEARSEDAGDRIQDVIDDPGDFYVNVHSTEFPDGAMRGQVGG